MAPLWPCAVLAFACLRRRGGPHPGPADPAADHPRGVGGVRLREWLRGPAEARRQGGGAITQVRRDHSGVCVTSPPPISYQEGSSGWQSAAGDDAGPRAGTYGTQCLGPELKHNIWVTETAFQSQSQKQESEPAEASLTGIQSFIQSIFYAAPALDVARLPAFVAALVLLASPCISPPTAGAAGVRWGSQGGGDVWWC